MGAASISLLADQICARYLANPKSHLAAVKKIIKYVNGTIEFGLWYSCDSTATLMGYYDAHWAGNSDDKKRTSEGCFFLGKNLVFWFSKKQNCISLLTTEVEYIATESSCSQLIWMRNMLYSLDSSASITVPSEVKAKKLYEKNFLTRRYQCKVERLQIKDLFKNGRRGKLRINGFVDTKNEE